MSDRREKADKDSGRKEANPLGTELRKAIQGLAQPHQLQLIVETPQGANPEQKYAQPVGEQQSVEARKKGNQVESIVEREEQGGGEHGSDNPELYEAGDRQEVGLPPLAVQQEPPWNWTSAQDQSVRLNLLYECSNSHNFAIGSGADYSSFVHLASTGSKSEHVWVVMIPRETLISQQPTLVLDVNGKRSSANFENYWGKWISSKAEYSCLFFLRLDFKPRSHGDFPAKMGSVFLRYAKVTLQQPDYLSVFPQLVAQTFESRCEMTGIKPLYKLMNSYFEGKPVDCWMIGCLFSILGMLVPNSEQYRYSLDLLIATDDFLIAQLQKTSESPFKTCLLRGLARCIYWNLDNFEVVCKKMLALFQQSTLSAEIEQTLSGTVEKWSDLLLERFAAVAGQLPNKLKLEVVKAWMLKQTEYMGICECLAAIYPSLADTTEIKTHVCQVLGNIRKSMQPAEAEAILFLLTKHTLGFTDILAESGLFGRFNSVIDRPVFAKVTLYSAILRADSRILDSLDLRKFYNAVLGSKLNFPLSRVVSELNTCEATEREILSAWRSNLPRLSGDNSNLDLCITTIDKDLASLPPALLPKFTYGAMEEFLIITKKHHDITNYVSSISRMQTQLFAEVYAQKCVEGKLVTSLGDLMSQVKRGESNRFLELLINTALTHMKVPTCTEIEDQLFNSGDIEPVWKDVLEQYEVYKHLAFPEGLAVNITTLALKILQKDIEIKKLLSLQRKVPPLEQMTSTLCLALVHTRPEIMPTFHASVENIVAEAAGTQVHLNNLQVFLECIVPELVGNKELCQELEQVKTTCQEVKLSDFALTGNLARLQLASELSVNYQHSELFKRYFTTVKGSQPLTVVNVVQVCASAEHTMFEFLSTCIPNIALSPVMTLVNAFRFPNWENEITIIRKRKDWEAQFDTLSSLLTIYYSSDSLLTHCQIMLKISEAISMNDPPFMEKVKSFVQVSKQLATVTVESFMQLYQETSRVLYPEGVSKNEIEALGSLFRVSEMTEFLNALTKDKLEYIQECAEDVEPTVSAVAITNLQQLWVFYTDFKKEWQSYLLVMELTKRKMGEWKLQELTRAYDSCCQSMQIFKKLCTDYKDGSSGSQEHVWNWPVVRTMPFRIYFHFEGGNAYQFSLQWNNSSRNFTSQAISGMKDVWLWRVSCTYEELQAKPQLILDANPNYQHSSKQEGQQFTYQAEYSCQYLFTMWVGGRVRKQLSEDSEISFLRYAKGILPHTSGFLREFPQLITQACALGDKFKINKSTELYSFIDSCMNAKPLDLWRAGCLLAVLGLPGTFSDKKYANSLALLTMIDDKFVEQIRKTRDNAFKTCLVQGTHHCIYWNLLNTSVVSQVLRNLFKEPSFAPYTERYMSDKMHTFGISELQPFLMILEELFKPFQTSIITQAMLQQTDYSNLFQLLDRAYPVITPADIIYTLQQTIMHIRKQIKEREVSQLMSLLKGKTEEFKSMVLDSGVVSLVDKLLQSPSAKNIPFYVQLLVAEKRLVARLNWDAFYKLMKSEFSISRVLSELNSDEKAQKQIISIWLNRLPWTPTWPNLDKSGFVACIQALDVLLLALESQFSDKVAYWAVDELLERRLKAGNNFLTYIQYIDKMKFVRFRDIYSRKCLEKGLVKDVQQLESQYHWEESCVLQQLLGELYGLPRILTYDEVESNLLACEDIEESWKPLMMQYYEWKQYSVAKNLVADISKFGQKLQNKTIKIQKLHLLQRKSPESLKRMTETIVQALKYTKGSPSPTFHRAVEQIVNEAANVPHTFAILQGFLDQAVPDLAEKSTVVQELQRLKGTYLEVELASYALPPQLAELLHLAETSLEYSDSALFRDYLCSAKGKKTLTLSNTREIFTSATNQMTKFLSSILSSINTTPLTTLVAAFKYAGWKGEIAILRKRKEWDIQLDTLYECLEMYQSRDKLIATSHMLLNACEVVQLADEAFTAQLARVIRVLEKIEKVTVGDFMATYKDAKAMLQPEGQSEDIAEVFAVLLRSSELVRFSSGLTSAALAHLLECVGVFESSVTANMLAELELVWTFVANLKGKTYENATNYIKAKLSETKYLNIVRTIQTCCGNLPALKEFKANPAKKEIERKQIEVMEESSTAARQIQIFGKTLQLQANLTAGFEAIEETYPLLNLCLKYRYAIPELELFPLLLDLTQSLNSRFNRKVRRETARKWLLCKVFEEDERLRGVYLKAAELWTSCYSLRSAFHIFQGKEQDCLAAFLLDRKDSSQLCKVLRKLAAIQNHILSEYFSVQEARKVPRKPSVSIPLQSLQQSQVLSLSCSLLDSDMQLPNLEQDQTVASDYVRLEEIAMRRLEMAAMMDTEHMTFSQYQFELYSENSKYQPLITDLRTGYAQRELTSEEEIIVKDAFSRHDSETNEAHQSRLLLHYEQLESLMCDMSHSESIPNLTIQQLAQQNHKFSDLYAAESPLTGLNISLIVAVYEQLEMEFFPYAQKLLSLCQEDSGLSDILRTLKFENIPPNQDLILAVKRLLLRVLLGDTQSSQSISQYITRADFWDVTVSKEAVKEFGRVLEGRHLGETLRLYEGLIQISETEPTSTIKPRINKRRRGAGFRDLYSYI